MSIGKFVLFFPKLPEISHFKNPLPQPQLLQTEYIKTAPRTQLHHDLEGFFCAWS